MIRAAFVIWKLATVVQRNQEDRVTEGPARQAWIAFGDDGAGNAFCVDRQRGDVVHVWSAIDQSVTLLAADLVGFWTLWTAGRLPR